MESKDVNASSFRELPPAHDVAGMTPSDASTHIVTLATRSFFIGAGCGIEARRMRFWRGVVTQAIVLCALAACGGPRTAEVKPGERNYPTLNPHPTDVVQIRALIPPTLKVEFQSGYTASPSAGGLIGSGTECQHEIGLAVTAPFYVNLPIKMTADGNSNAGAAEADKFEPGHCLWRFTGVLGRSVNPNSLQGALVRFRNDASSPREVVLDVWCVRDASLDVSTPSAPEFCGDLSFLSSLPRAAPAEVLASIPLSQRNDSEVTIGPNTQIINVTFHDLDAARMSGNAAQK